MKGDRIFGLVMTLVALAYIASALQIQTSFLSDPVGSKTFPIGVGIIIIICGVYLMVKPDPDPEWPVLRTFGALAIAVTVLIGYAYALRPMGFLIPTAITAAILSYQISPNIRNSIFAGLGLSIGLFVVFKFALGLGLIPFPEMLTG